MHRAEPDVLNAVANIVQRPAQPPREGRPTCRERLDVLARHHPERAIERAQHAVERVAPAQDVAGGGDVAIGALAPAEPRVFSMR